MTSCVACGSELSDGTFLCRHHPLALPEEWALGNRILCDFIHRGILPERLSVEQRDDEVVAFG